MKPSLIRQAPPWPTGVSVQKTWRARRAWRLYHELDANLEVLGLMLDMQDEIERLRTRLRCV